MPKVLQVSEAHGWSGGTAQLLALSEGLRRKGWDVLIACRPGSGLETHAREMNFATFPVALREDYDVISAWRLASLIRRQEIDVVHAHHNRSHCVCLLAKFALNAAGQAPVLVVSRRVSFPPGRNPFSRWKYRSRLIDRIVAVADAYEAMTSDRVYRPALSAEAAQTELLECAGTQFDPAVVEVATTVIASYLEEEPQQRAA